MTLGGDGIIGYSHTKETKNKISKANKGKYCTEETKNKMRMNNARANLGKSLSIETKNKISIANKGKIGNRKGVKLSKETIEKISLSNKIYYSNMKNKLINLILKGAKPFFIYNWKGNFIGEWINQYECAEELNISQSCISDCLLNKKKQSNGYVFIFKEHFNDELLQQKLINAFKYFYICTLEGKHIEFFYSQIECARQYGLDAGKISNCLHGKQKSHKNFTFKYIDPNDADYILASDLNNIVSCLNAIV